MVYFIQEKAANALALASSTIRWVMGPTGTTVIFPDDMGLPSLFDSKPCRWFILLDTCACCLFADDDVFLNLLWYENSVILLGVRIVLVHRVPIHTSIGILSRSFLFAVFGATRLSRKRCKQKLHANVCNNLILAFFLKSLVILQSWLITLGIYSGIGGRKLIVN